MKYIKNFNELNEDKKSDDKIIKFVKVIDILDSIKTFEDITLEKEFQELYNSVKKFMKKL